MLLDIWLVEIPENTPDEVWGALIDAMISRLEAGHYLQGRKNIYGTDYVYVKNVRQGCRIYVRPEDVTFVDGVRFGLAKSIKK